MRGSFLPLYDEVGEGPRDVPDEAELAEGRA